MKKNIYYDPEAFGLRLVAEMEFEGGYSFDTYVLWVNDKKEFFVANDSGCSCPSPFEGHDLTSLVKIEKFQDLLDWVESAKAEQSGYRWPEGKLDEIGARMIAAYRDAR